MTERASVYERTQVGVEVTPGTAVACPTQLVAASFGLKVGENTDTFTPIGSKYPVITVLNREWASMPITGKPAYDELIYPLVTLLDPGSSPTTLTGTPNAYQWDFTTNPSGPDAIKTLTVQRGSSVRAARAANGFMKSFGYTLSKMRGTSIKGEFMGTALTDGITMTATPTILPMVPVNPGDVSVYVDSSFGGIGTTKLGRCFDVDWQLNNKADGVFALDASTGTSFAATVETKPTLEMTLLVEADSAGMAFLSGYRSSTTYFIRVEAVGPLIATGNNYLFRMDMAAKVNQPQEFKDEQGAWAIGFKFAVVVDSSLNAFTARVVNTRSSL